MSKYTREQIQKARHKADDAAAQFGMSTNEERAWIDTFTEALGLDVESEKPEPGTIGITCDGLAAYVDGGGVWRVILAYGDWRNANDADAITPARVASAKAVELSEAEVGELFDEYAETFNWTVFDHNFSLSLRDKHQLRADTTATVNAALAKHGTGRVEVSRDEVLAAVEKWMTGTPWGVSRNEKITDAVMELLEASK